MNIAQLTWDYSDPRKGTSMPARFFFDQGVFEEEKAKIFMNCWHVVGHVNEFAKPGDFIVQHIFEQSVVVMLGRDGKITAFHNACRHRGNRLIEERRGNKIGVIRCGYHSWCYNQDGSLRAAPRTENLDDFNKNEWGLKPVRMEIFANFVFITLDDNARPVAEMANGAEAEMRRFLPDLDNLELASEADVIVDANWKVIQENSIEGYHFDLSGPVHKDLAALIDFEGYALTAHGDWWTYIGPPNKGAKSAYGVPLEGSTWQTDWFFNVGLFPNTTFYSFPYTDMVGTFIMIPLTPEKSLLRFGYYKPKGREMPPVTKAAIEWMNTQLGPEDIELNVTNQKGLHSIGFGAGKYLIDPARPNQSENLVHHFHTLCYKAIRGMTDGTSFDYVIAGAGSAGCVLATRLSEDPKCRVLLLEAGPEDRSMWLRMPAGMSKVVWGDRYSWAFTSAPEPHLENRRLGHPRGKVIGGSSSINGMVWLRGHPRDFDGWAQLGARGWSYDDVLPYFCRSESAPALADARRGKGGPIRITRGNIEASPLASAFVEAGVEAGYPRTPDFNGLEQEGFGAVERSIWQGRRWSAAHAYLSPARGRPNLTIVTGAHVLGVVLDGRRATGLRYAKDGREHLASAGEVILSAGAIGSPHILQLSGIGPKRHLEAAGIAVRHDLSDVGENLNDHPDLVIQHDCKQRVSLYPVTRAPRSWLAGLEWMLKGTGPAATNHFEAGGFIISRPELDHPDIQFTFMPLAVVPGGTQVLAAHAFQVYIDLMRPRSRGYVRAINGDPFKAPEILFNYLDDPQDLADLRAGVHLLRNVLSQPALGPYAGDEIFPGPDVATDEQIDRWIRQTLETCYHPVGTCRMGAADDPGAVVDPECRVRGLEGLRVVDASIMPAIVSANTNASTIMIAEKASDIIRGQTPLRAVQATHEERRISA